MRSQNQILLELNSFLQILLSLRVKCYLRVSWELSYLLKLHKFSIYNFHFFIFKVYKMHILFELLWHLDQWRCRRKKNCFIFYREMRKISKNIYLVKFSWTGIMNWFDFVRSFEVFWRVKDLFKGCVLLRRLVSLIRQNWAVQVRFCVGGMVKVNRQRRFQLIWWINTWHRRW